MRLAGDTYAYVRNTREARKTHAARITRADATVPLRLLPVAGLEITLKRLPRNFNMVVRSGNVLRLLLHLYQESRDFQFILVQLLRSEIFRSQINRTAKKTELFFN